MINNEDYMAFNQYSAQMNALSNQKNQMKMVIEELKSTNEELAKSKQEKVFKNLGAIIIEKKKEDAISDLKKEIETLGARVETLTKQEDLVNKKLQPLKAKLDAQVKENQAKDKK
jgi:prefoldin beta subunit